MSPSRTAAGTPSPSSSPKGGSEPLQIQTSHRSIPSPATKTPEVTSRAPHSYLPPAPTRNHPQGPPPPIKATHLLGGHPEPLVLHLQGLRPHFRVSPVPQDGHIAPAAPLGPQDLGRGAPGCSRALLTLQPPPPPPGFLGLFWSTPTLAQR